MTASALNLAARLLSQDRQIDHLCKRILKYLGRRSGVSLCELARDIPGFSGNATWGKEDKNIILWADMSSAAITAMSRLIEKDEIVPTPTSWLVYNFDGGVLDMPIASSYEKRYDEPHWFPLVFAGNCEATA